jgi:hypothetical protein
MAGLAHLATRFFGAIKPGPPHSEDERWAMGQLSAGERAIWERMNNPDRRHAIDVARAVVAQYPDAVGGEPIGKAVVAAALLHDSGKVVCGFRTPSRVLATVVWAVLDDDVADRWTADSTRQAGYRARLAQYRKHPELGGRLLAEAGSDPLTRNWAEQHHLPEDAWTVPVAVGRLLKDCDDD